VRYALYRPCRLDELVLRYAEYITWFRTRPDKVKHLDFILAAVGNDDAARNAFFDRLHRYTALPLPEDLHEVEVLGGVLAQLRPHLSACWERVPARGRRVVSLAGRTLVDPVTMFRKACYRVLAPARSPQL
jgi:hypothetical protein